jgi:hypothetical protein
VGWSATHATPVGRFRTTPRASGDDEPVAAPPVTALAPPPPPIVTPVRAPDPELACRPSAVAPDVEGREGGMVSDASSTAAAVAVAVGVLWAALGSLLLTSPSGGGWKNPARVLCPP